MVLHRGAPASSGHHRPATRQQAVSPTHLFRQQQDEGVSVGADAQPVGRHSAGVPAAVWSPSIPGCDSNHLIHQGNNSGAHSRLAI